MAPPPKRAIDALNAMKNIGFPVDVVKPVLRRLLKVYEDNYEYIEADNYLVLIDSVLEEQEAKAAGAVDNGPEQVRKRPRKPSEENPSPLILGYDDSGEASASLKKPKAEADASPGLQIPPQVDNMGKSIEPVSPQTSPAVKGTPQPSSSSKSAKHDWSLEIRRETRALARARRNSGEASSLQADEMSRSIVCYKEPTIEPVVKVQKDTAIALPPRFIDEEADDDLAKFEVPISVIRPPNHPVSAVKEDHQYQPNATEAVVAQNPALISDREKGKLLPSDFDFEDGKASELATSHNTSSSTIDVASSDTGEVKLLFSFNSDRPGLHIPSIDNVIRMVEERCFKSSKILSPDFSLMKAMKEMCQCASELISEPSNSRQENIEEPTPIQDSQKRSELQSKFDGMPTCSLNEHCATNEVNEHKKEDINKKGKEIRFSDSLVVVQQPQIALGDLRPPHDPNDIAKGEERVRISVLNEVSNEKYPTFFHYIPRNIIYQNAYVNLSLARIGDEDCCADCYMDCVAAAIPCACARETGGEFAYMSDGLVKGAFLDECISMNCKPEKHPNVYCLDCPLERSKRGAVSGKCKGHLVRKFIKECWSKCGCNMQCKNRVVQRGITRNLQVFFTPEGKGWGLRTLDELPRGAFVCEYVGEVLTNMELYDRTIQSTGNAKHTYPVLLDADWGSERVLKDEEALCLDATFYGNVARFVNHRCVDANMLAIPVEVETPDHHYYHLAFFTTRKIEQYEELTWDYGIDFDDAGHPVKAFKCRCGSKFCSDKRRPKSRSKSVVAMGNR